jgi:hypothetical protein
LTSYKGDPFENLNEPIFIRNDGITPFLPVEYENMYTCVAEGNTGIDFENKSVLSNGSTMYIDRGNCFSTNKKLMQSTKFS